MKKRALVVVDVKSRQNVMEGALSIQTWLSPIVGDYNQYNFMVVGNRLDIGKISGINVVGVTSGRFVDSIKAYIDAGIVAVIDLADALCLSPKIRVEAVLACALAGVSYVTPGIRVAPCKVVDLGAQARVISVCGNGKMVGKTTVSRAVAQYLLATQHEPVTVISIERSPLTLGGLRNYASDAQFLRGEGLSVLHVQKMGEWLPCLASADLSVVTGLKRTGGYVVVDNSGASIVPLISAMVLKLNWISHSRWVERCQSAIVSRISGRSASIALAHKNVDARRTEAIQLQTKPQVPRLLPRDLRGKRCLVVSRFSLTNDNDLKEGLFSRGIREIRNEVCRLSADCFRLIERQLEGNSDLIAIVDSGSALNRLRDVGLEKRVFYLGYAIPDGIAEILSGI